MIDPKNDVLWRVYLLYALMVSKTFQKYLLLSKTQHVVSKKTKNFA